MKYGRILQRIQLTVVLRLVRDFEYGLFARSCQVDFVVFPIQCSPRNCDIELQLVIVAPIFLSSHFFVDFRLLFNFFRVHLQILNVIFKQQENLIHKSASNLVAITGFSKDVEQSFSVGTRRPMFNVLKYKLCVLSKKQNNAPTQRILTPYLSHSRFSSQGFI